MPEYQKLQNISLFSVSGSIVPFECYVTNYLQ